MSKRNLFSELNTALIEAKQHSKNKLTLKSHTIEIPQNINISPKEIVKLRENFNMSRGVFAKYLHTSSRTLENWEQGRSKPNEQAITLLKLVKSHPETLAHIAAL